MAWHGLAPAMLNDRQTVALHVKLRVRSIKRIQKTSDNIMKTKQANLGVLRNFYEYDGPGLAVFGGNIAVNLDPLIFPGLPFAPKDIQGLADDLNVKLSAIITGGTTETAAKNKAFDALCDALNADANIVENGVGADLEKLLATGYLPVSTNRTSSPLDDTSIVSLRNNGTTQLLLQLLPVRNGKSYQVQTSTDGGKTWAEACISTQARRIVLMNLVPGTTYAVRARAIGGSTGASA